MTGTERVGDVESPAISRRQVEVLALLRAEDVPQSAADVARAIGLHVNTARAHLDALLREGLVQRMTEPLGGPGRPRTVYTSSGPVPGQRHFQLLAEILTGLVSSLDDGPSLARDTGAAWGRHLVDSPPPSRKVDAPEALERLETMLTGLGFRPSTDQRDAGVELLLRNCPFREIAQEHPDVICGLHLGLLQGALGELRAPLQATAILPFVTSHTCVARLRSQSALQSPPAPATDAAASSPAPVQQTPAESSSEQLIEDELHWRFPFKRVESSQG